MKQGRFFLFATLITALLTTGCGNKASTEQCEKADQLVAAVQKAKNYPRLMAVADSLAKEGSLSPAKTYYWQGYASDRMGKKRMAEFYWKASLENAVLEKDMDVYAKTASRLANLLTMRGDYESALKTARPAVQLLEEQKCDTTSDYTNLLIYIGCCQAGLGNTGNEMSDGFDRAYQKHLDNIDKNHTDAAYKDAIAGLINIAYACNTAGQYKISLDWIARFGELLNQYEQRPGTNSEYVDKQLARFNIYKAVALHRLGNAEEAAKIYEDYQGTQYSQTPEGRITANDYLTAADRWGEAADNYRSLDTALHNQQGDAYTIDNIENLVLKKYRANNLAGRRDSAIAVSMQICDSLQQAFALQRQVNSEEQATIINEVEKMNAQQAEATRQRQMSMWAALGALLLCFLAYALYRRYTNQRLKVAYKELKTDYNQLDEEVTARERRESELRISRQLQQYMLPQNLPVCKGASLEPLFIPGTGISSDFYDCVVNGDQLVFCIGNSCEQAISKSIGADTVHTLFRAVATAETDPARMATAINKALIGREPDDTGVALFIGIINPTTGLLTYCNAGHSVPLLLSDGVAALPTDENKAIGIDTDAVYTTRQTELAKGSMLFCFTDGLAQAKNSEGKFYGAKMVRGAALQSLKLNPQPKPFLENMNEALMKYTGNTAQKNDITMLIIERT